MQHFPGPINITPSNDVKITTLLSKLIKVIGFALSNPGIEAIKIAPNIIIERPIVLYFVQTPVSKDIPPSNSPNAIIHAKNKDPQTIPENPFIPGPNTPVNFPNPAKTNKMPKPSLIINKPVLSHFMLTPPKG